MAPSAHANGETTSGMAAASRVNGATSPSLRGTTNGTTTHNNNQSKSRLIPPNSSTTHDLICVGFGPASLAIAIAIHDALESGNLQHAPNVLFLEKQTRFAWHAGMLLPGAKMQISFIKDMATLRDPKSHFTFLNYLHEKGRLVDFTNLGTFLPARVEYEDYLRWCAGHFDHVVQYGAQAVSVSPVEGSGDGMVGAFDVVERDVDTGASRSHRGRNIILAMGGQASLPKAFPANNPRIIHSSQYAHLMPKMLSDKNAQIRVAVVGAGQSAAEIFNNVQTLYPNSKTYLIMKSDFMKPSDDSPFVNSIFDPDYVNTLYPKSAQYRQHLIADTKATNYGVVRLELIEHIYERMYEQLRDIGKDETKWPHRILGQMHVASVEAKGNYALDLRLRPVYPNSDHNGHTMSHPQIDDGYQAMDTNSDQILEVDLLVAATGYKRDGHLDMLRPSWSLLPTSQQSNGTERDESERFDRWVVGEDVDDDKRVLEVSREYKVKFSENKVAPDAGVWLQGCCEATHGLSDTLLSVLATRSGEIVESIFGAQ